MGEYAKINGEMRKIGTCEMMYYLEMGELVSSIIEPDENSLDPRRCIEELWFKLPGVEWGTIIKVDVEDIENEHGIVQLSSKSGLLVNMPCTAETRFPKGNGYFRNGGTGGYFLAGMGIRGGKEALLVQCVDCKRSWRIEKGDGEYERAMESLPVKLAEDMKKSFEITIAEFCKGVV